MPFGLPGNSGTPSSGSWLARLFAKPHPDAFTVGLRVVDRWRFALSGVDPYRPGGIATLQHGTETLRLARFATAGPGPRPGHVVLTAVDADTSAPVELSVPEGDVHRFGVTL